MSSSNQATELSMDDILASIRRIIAEEPDAKASKSGPRMGPLPDPEPAKDVVPDVAQRGARSSFNQLTQRLNEVLDTRELPAERKSNLGKDDSLGLAPPEDLDQPYTATRRPPPLPEPAQEEAAPTRVVSSTSNEMLRRQVWSQNDGNINNRIGRLDPKPLTTTLARAVGSAPAVAFDAYRRRADADSASAPLPPKHGPLPPTPEAKKPPQAPIAEAKPVAPSVPQEAKSPPPPPPSVPPAEAVEADALAGRLAASIRDLDATLGTKPSEKKPDEKLPTTERDKLPKARTAATLPPPKSWPSSKETSKAAEPAKPIPPVEIPVVPPVASKTEEKPHPVSEAKPSATSDTASVLPAKSDVGSAKAPAPPAATPSADKQLTAAEAAALLVKSAAPLAPVALPADGQKTRLEIKPADAPSARPALSVEPAVPAPSVTPAAAINPVPAAVLPAPAAVRSLEDTVSDLLRPVLRQWLDEHMPRIFEKVLREELAGRVTPPPKL